MNLQTVVSGAPNVTKNTFESVKMLFSRIMHVKTYLLDCKGYRRAPASLRYNAGPITGSVTEKPEGPVCDSTLLEFYMDCNEACRHV